MVDMDTYRSTQNIGDDMLEDGEFLDDVLESDEIPQGSLALLLPSTIIGYGFHNRKWGKLMKPPSRTASDEKHRYPPR